MKTVTRLVALGIGLAAGATVGAVTDGATTGASVGAAPVDATVGGPPVDATVGGVPVGVTVGGVPDGGDYVWLSGACCEYFPGDVVRVRRESRPGGDDRCRRGRAQVTVRYGDRRARGRYDVQVFLKRAREHGRALWMSDLLPGAGTDQGDLRVRGAGEVVSVGVVALDRGTGDRVWSRRWDSELVVTCGRDFDLVIEDAR